MPPLLVGIAGGTGSGKTTLATKLVAALPAERAALIQHDWYYRDRSHLSPAERELINFDEPGALENQLLVDQLRLLKSGRVVDCPQYDFGAHLRRAECRRVEPCSVIVVEGILLFAVAEVRELFDLRIFVDTDDDVRLLRRIKRDMSDRSRSIESIEAQYHGSVRPMHNEHVVPSRRHAHLIVPEGGENAQALEVIVGRLLYLLADSGTPGRG